MRTETTGSRIARVGVNGRDLVNTLMNRARILIKDREESRERAVARSTGPSVQERRDDLVRFYERYEDLVEALCDSAQYGPTPKLERDYAEVRAWMCERYPQVQPFLLAYLREDPEVDTEYDAFDGLMSAESIEAFLRHDDGGMISRITRTREALNLYGEHLRQLAARTA